MFAMFVPKFTVTFVCTGNICRSPLGEKLLRQYLGVPTVAVRSAGTSSWHVGEPMDPRAARVLAQRGCDTAHTARRIDQADLRSDLIIAMAGEHASTLIKKGVPASKVHLLAEFHPNLEDCYGIPDPMRGTLRDFENVAELISESLPLLSTTIETIITAVLEDGDGSGANRIGGQIL